MHTQDIRALLTSQVPLGIAGKTVYRLGALPVPRACAPDEDCARDASVELLVQRAKAADQRFKLTGANHSLVTDICRRLDGNPLAIELAAVRVPALGLSGLLDRLNFRSKTAGVPSGHAGCPPQRAHGNAVCRGTVR